MPTLSLTEPLSQLNRIQASTALSPLITELLWLGLRREDSEQMTRDVLVMLLSALGCDSAALMQMNNGMWEAITEVGNVKHCPSDLLAEALDREHPVVSNNWAAALLAPRTERTEVLAVHLVESRGSHQKSATLTTNLDAAAAALDAIRIASYDRRRQRRRVERLTTMLQLAQEWSLAQEVQPLLLHMAEAATRLLGADRASIFIWDKANHQLVARPALGVPGGILKIPDNVGIVGQVLQSGKPRRVGQQDNSSEIHRDIDAQLNYQTQSLLCVPLRAGNGELLGVFELINKHEGDFTNEDEQILLEIAAQAAPALTNTQQLESALTVNQRLVDQLAEDVRIIGQCPAIQAIHSTIRRVAPTDLAVLVLGENGTGKEVVSQAIHYLSPRRNQPFIAVNCAALTETLLESELFGHEKGAFTDAIDTRQGKFELADSGTLFLDEIGDLSRGGQAKLLRVLEEKIVTRVGGSKTIPVDVRVIAATNQNLAEMVRTKKFREDLFFRLNVVSLELSPLRSRGDDIMLLAEHFLHDFCKRARRKAPKFSAAAKQRLEQHSWPGNVRELRNLMERVAFLSVGDKIEADDIAFIISPHGSPAPFAASDDTLSNATAQFQIDYIKQAIERMRGNMSDAATALGLHRSNLYRKMRQLDMSIEDLD
jgi:transcriptional regulator with GAF, ATPase, and Fis domain